jgi:glycosyltransferase involved in cell wall biosynthesis
VTRRPDDPDSNGIGRTVDVVIPTMGRESVQRALESVRAQTHAVSTTFVVLDDPLREEWVRSILRSNEVLIVTGGRLGGAEARNLGARASEAAFVAFLDDDDWWEPGKTFAQLRALLGQDAAVSFTTPASMSPAGELVFCLLAIFRIVRICRPTWYSDLVFATVMGIFRRVR